MIRSANWMLPSVGFPCVPFFVLGNIWGNKRDSICLLVPIVSVGKSLKSLVFNGCWII